MKTFINVAQMKLATLQAGQFVETGGKVVKGDGGQARYLVTAGVSPDDSVSPDLANGNHALYQGVGAVNDLSQAYVFDTFDTMINSTLLLPVGKVVSYKKRGAFDGGFACVVSGTGSANTRDIIASTSVNRSYSIKTPLVSTPELFGAIGDNVTNDSKAVADAVSYGEDFKLPVYITRSHLMNSDKIRLLGNNDISGTGTLRIVGQDEGLSIRGSNIKWNSVKIIAESTGNTVKGVVNFRETADLLENVNIEYIDIDCDALSGTPITDSPADILKLRRDIKIISPTLKTVRTDTFHYGIFIQSSTERLRIVDFDITLPVEAANPIAIYGNAKEFYVGEGRIHSGGHSGIAASISSYGVIANNIIKGITQNTEAAIEIEYKANHALDPTVGSSKITVTGNQSDGCNTGFLVTHRDGVPTTAQLPSEIVTSGNQYLNCTGRALNLTYGKNISIGDDYYHSSGLTEAALIGTIGQQLDNVTIKAKFLAENDDGVLVANGGTDVLFNAVQVKSLTGRAVTISASSTVGFDMLGGKYDGATRGISDDGGSGVTRLLNAYVVAGSSFTVSGLATGSTVGNLSYSGTAPSLGGGVAAYNNNTV